MHKKQNKTFNLALPLSSAVIIYKNAQFSFNFLIFLNVCAFYLNIHVSITKFIFILNIWR